MKKIPTHAELDAILGETRAKFDAILAATGEFFPEVGEEFDIDALIAGMGLDTPIDDADIADMLANPSAPAARTAPTAPALPAHAAPPGSVKISIRVPGRILAAFKTRAAERRQPYQRLLNQVLRDAARGWETPAGT